MSFDTINIYLLIFKYMLLGKLFPLYMLLKLSNKRQFLFTPTVN